MISEIRHILFQKDDVLAAVINFRKKRNKALPPGSVISIRIQEEPEISCFIKMTSDKSKKPAGYEFKYDDILAALILYCIDKKVPLPVESQKSLQLFGERVGLIVTINCLFP